MQKGKENHHSLMVTTTYYLKNCYPQNVTIFCRISLQATCQVDNTDPNIKMEDMTAPQK